jgi:Starch-binding associating with outer membrane
MRVHPIITATTAGLLLFSSCKKQLDINHDPNNPPIENGTPQLVFPGAVLSTASSAGGELAILGMLWSEFATEDAYSSQYRNLDSYNATGSDLNINYGELYSGALNDYKLILDKAAGTGDWNFYLMATVMKAYTYQVLVDLYDKVPYSQALQGATNLQPGFNAGDSIYESLLVEIDTALNKDFSATSNSQPGPADYLFAGDISKWMAFANTLKLKMYLRMINSKPQEAQDGIVALYNSGATFLTEDAGVAEFTTAPGKQNPFYSYNIFALNTTNNLRASNTFLSWLKAKNDPRIVSYFGSASATGIHQGDFQNTTDPTYKTAAVFVQQPFDPVQFISAAESYFMQAEARERYFSGDQAKALYDVGVKTAFDFWGFDATSFTDPGGAYEYPTGGTLDDKIEAIITQKWASLPGSHALEGWFERNRTGFPKSSDVYSDDLSYVPGQFVVAKNSVIGNNYPKRLVFPDVERSTNKSTPIQVPITTPVWWGK